MEIRNAEGYMDMTAGRAIENVSNDIRRGDVLYIKGDKFEGDVVVLTISDQSPFMLCIPLVEQTDPVFVMKTGMIALSGGAGAHIGHFMNINRLKTPWEPSGSLPKSDHEIIKDALAEMLGIEKPVERLTAKIEVPKVAESDAALALAEQAAEIWEKAFYAVCRKEK